MERTLRPLLFRWWSDPDDYQWRIDFIRSLGLLPALRILVAAIGAIMGVMAALTALVPPDSAGVWPRVGWAAVAVAGLLWVLRWLLRDWPTLRQSVLLVAVADIVITFSCVLLLDPMSAIASMPLLLCVGGYVVFFHGPKVHAGHIAWSVLSVLAVAVWMALAVGDASGISLAANKAVTALLVTVAILPILQFGFWLLQASSMQSLTDPLTELTNRRGLSTAVARLGAAYPVSAPLCAVLIDIDDFKAVNDVHGHTVGDEVLIRTAQQIRSCVGRDAVVARLGGEEFLVVDRLHSGPAILVADQIRRRIAEPANPPITVSIGLATTPHHLHHGNLIDKLVDAADAAMYLAKRRGGNGVALTSEVL